MENFVQTEQDEKEAAKELFNAIRNFPKASERKDSIFQAMDTILRSLGSYLNDPELEFKREVKDGREGVTYKDVYGCHWQSVQDDDPKGFFQDVLKLVLKYNRELNGTYEQIKEYFEEK